MWASLQWTHPQLAVAAKTIATVRARKMESAVAKQTTFISKSVLAKSGTHRGTGTEKGKRKKEKNRVRKRTTEQGKKR